MSGNNDDGKQATIHSREQNASSKDDWLNMLEDIDSDDSWNSGNSDGEYGSEENQNSRKCTGKDAHSYDDMPISQENKKSRLDTNIEKKASMLNEMLPAKEPVREDIEEIKAELHELLDAELDTDSDWSSSMSQETSTSRVRERKVLEKFIGDVKEETSPNVPYVTSITDNKLPVSNDDGKCNLRQQTSSKDDLLDNLEDFISDGDWNRSDSNEKENQNKMCKEKDAQSSDDDFLTDLKSFCDIDGKVSIKATVVTTLDKVKQGSAPNESKYINSTPGSYEAKTLPQDSMSTPAAGRESDVDNSDDLRDIETLLDGMSTYWSEKKKQSTDIAVLDRKEKPPENKSVINNEDGKRTVCQSCEKNASSKDDILDMLEDFDSDAEWNSGNSDGEYGSEENQNSRKCTRKDAQSSDDGFLADPNPCDAGGTVLSKATVVSTLGDVKQGPASSKSKYNDITPSQYGAITLPKDPIKSKSTIAGRDSDDKSDAKGEDDEIGGSQTDTKEGVSLCEVFEFSYSDSDNESIGFNEDEELDIMADIMSSDALTGTKHDQLQESGSSSCMYDTSSDEEERARGHPALEREGLVSTSNIHNLMYGQGGLSKTPVSDVISNAGYCDVVYDEDELDIMNDVMSFSGDVVDTPQRKHEPGCHGHKYETSSDEEERSQLKVEKEEFAVTTNVHKMMFGRSEIGDRVPDFSDMDYDDYDLDLNCSDICATETCTQTRNNNPAAPSSRHSDSKSTRSGECEDVKASDDKNDNTSVIRLSEGECILRNDYSLSSDADFRGYTYEPSSDEEVQVQSTLKAKEPLSNDGNSMWSPSERDSDRGLGSSRRSRDTALSTDKVGTNEDSSTRSKDDSLPCINRREDISVRRNHSISSGDFRDNSSESSSDESAPSDQRDVDSVDTIASEEYLDQAKVDNELLQMPTMSIKDVVYAPTLVPDDEEETDCALTTEKSMKSAMMLNFMQIVMEDKGAASEDSYTNLNESNNSRGQDRSPRRNSVERGNYSGAGATNQDCSCLSTTGTESGLLQEFKKPTRMADNVQIPPEHGHYGSHQHFLQQKDNRKADENLHQSNDAIKSTQRRERVPQSNGDDKNTLKIEFPQFDGVVKITQMEEEKPLSSDAVKVASDRKSVLKSIGDTMVTQLNREIPRSNGVAKVTEGKLQRERHFTAKYLNRCQTQAPTDNTCSTCPKETATAVGLKSVIPQPKPKAYRSRQFTDKYLLKNRVKKHTRQAVHPQKEILAQLNNDTMSNHIKEQSNRTVDSRSRHYTAKYLTTRRSNADVDERTINQNAIRWPEEPPSYGMSDSSTIDGNKHMNNTLTHETSVGGNVDTLRKDSLIRATSRIPIDVHYRRGISVNGCRNIGS
ncbi:dentin sialophosphoprotein-like isoform X2 [Argopecten irradians]|uniref:dentin sialophosphoprotein-like isoform X2 n=1 Tax=Argopecten irradians TaxID=31199 RepID=UPI00372012E0